MNYPLLNVPGSYQGWNPEDSTTVIWSVQQDETYDGYIFFGEDATLYKFAKGTWDVNWGDNGADGVLDPGGDNILAGDAGLYRLAVDLNTLTYETTKTDWAIIGDATPNGWDADTPMVYDPETGLWSVTVDLNVGSLKFRANGNWDINLGDDDPAVPGLQYEGANINITEAGNYTITLDLTQAIYTYELTKN
ncbi:MAG: SusF/SusE family outer membrane protein [Bacteroidetes bacterium]|nr:MAG: SusF/SusE family outer membrane protein [Bacteroidota bacterium]